MTLKNIIESYLKEPIKGIKEEGGNWYTIIKKENPDSSRFGLCIVDKNQIKIYDRKNSTTKTIKVSSNIKLPEIKENSQFIPVYEDIKNILNKGVTQSHSYLKGMESFFNKSVFWKIVNNQIFVPYTRKELITSGSSITWTGAKWYPDKKSLKNSKMKGSFHPHKYRPENKVWVLGEGFKESLIASQIIEDANSLEVGGSGNMQAVISEIPKSDLIYVMGENDSIEFYERLLLKNPHIKISFPTKGKDFADQYILEKNISSLKLQITGNSIKQKNIKYKPLGISELKACVYSKITKSVHKLNPSRTADVLRVCFNPTGWEKLKKSDRELYGNKVFTECLRVGDYKSDYEYGVGLWKYKDQYYYNTGESLYSVSKGSIKSVSYEDVLNNDFLLVKQYTDQPFLSDDSFDNEGLKKAIVGCDWVIPEHGYLLLGFLIQSIYAGSIDFRPILWIMSDRSTAGKSWLTSWLKQNVLINNRSQESGKTSAAGLRQDTHNYSGPVFIDEFGEKGSAYKDTSKEILEMLRTAATGTAPIKIGSVEQTAIKQRIRFSPILSCIDGYGSIEEQDYNRIIVIKLISRDKDRFYSDVEPLFKKLEGGQGGFVRFALERFYLYQKWLPYFKKITMKDFKGHRFRGIASILTGYAIYENDIKKAEDLYERLKSNDEDMFSSYYLGFSNDFFLNLMGHLVSNRITEGATYNLTYKRVQDSLDSLIHFGFKLSMKKDKLYIDPKLASQFLSKVKFGNFDPPVLARMLRNSKNFIGCGAVTFIGRQKNYCLIFDVKGIL